jgi:hypothetical protein
MTRGRSLQLRIGFRMYLSQDIVAERLRTRFQPMRQVLFKSSGRDCGRAVARKIVGEIGQSEALGESPRALRGETEEVIVSRTMAVVLRAAIPNRFMSIELKPGREPHAGIPVPSASPDGDVNLNLFGFAVGSHRACARRSQPDRALPNQTAPVSVLGLRTQTGPVS